VSESGKHERAARDEAHAAKKLLETGPHHPTRSQDDLLGALRHSRNAAAQIVQALMARRLEAKNRDA
jgi:hypothetical protein